ncbi:MAG: pyruvate carboxylase subunit B [Oscillospiraceae bacterium]|nr:pyruvate carboxylase subunit B [Oscillospiraceae bacterium]
MRKIQLTETVLRDANQSLMSTRMPMDSFRDILTQMDKVGYYSVECWGGATFDSCIRFLDEDPWERLAFIRQAMPNTKLQMLLRGQNLLGYKHYPDDVVRRFVATAVDTGIDIIRIFDALNDLDNLRVSVDETLRRGAHASCAISYTVSPVHSVENYVRIAKEMEDMGAQSICVKDMAGIMSPQACGELFTALRESVKVPLILHSHCSTGYAYMTYLKAIESGVDVLDTAISSFSGGVSQPPTETVEQVIRDYGFVSGCDLKAMGRVNTHFKSVFDQARQNGLISDKSLRTDPFTLTSQIPGGMYSNLLSQLKEQNILDRLDEILEEVPRVRKDFGYPPLVTPISQMVGTQSVMNVLRGERYGLVIESVRDYVRGEYGKSPSPIDSAVAAKVLASVKGEQATVSQSTFEAFREKHPEFNDKDLLTLLLFPQVGQQFLQKREELRKSRFGYSFKSREDLRSIEHEADIDSDTLALLTGILAYKLNVKPNALKLNKVCRG